MTFYPTKKLGDVLDYEQPTRYIVNSTDYSDSYETPVLTAGKTFIKGYTNEKENIFPADELPVIIFDDFTTASQLVDFKFKVKSSAMKILHTKKDEADTKYLFYVMQTIKHNHVTHKRYWISEYKNLEVPLPPLEVQKKIVGKLESVLTKISEARKLRAEVRENADILLSAELHKIFEEGKRKGWEEKELEGLINTIVPPTKIKKGDFKNEGLYPIIDQSQDQISGWTNKKSDLVSINKPVVIFGDHTCAIKYSEEPFAQGADGIKILNTSEDLLPRFLYLTLKNKPIRTEGYRRHFYKLKKYKISIPPLTEQNKIVSHLDSLSEKIKDLQEAQKVNLSDLSVLEQSILSKTFTGEFIEENDKEEIKNKRLIESIKGLTNLSHLAVRGMANAGEPFAFAEETNWQRIPYPKDKFKKRELFAIEIEGDSMNKARVGDYFIEDGDYVVVEPGNTPENGDIVLAIIDNNGVVKRIEGIGTKKTKLVSDSTNKKHKPIVVSSEENDFNINGKIIDVIKGDTIE